MPGLTRLLVLVIVVWLFFSLARRLLLLLSLPGQEKEEHQKRAAALLVHDLQCGRFISEREALQISFRGQTLHFCSQECLDLYTNLQVSKKQENK